MSLRARVTTYLVVLHLAFGGATAFLLRQSPAWLLVVELAGGVSLLTGLWLAGRMLRALQLGQDIGRLVEEGDATTRLVPMGDAHVDRLIAAHNAMVDALRTERVRLREQHHFLQKVLSASPSGVVVLDFDQRVVDMNAAAERLLGVTLTRASGVALAELPSPLTATLAGLPDGASAVAGATAVRRIRCYRGTFRDRGFPRAFLLLDELTDEARRFERAAYEKLIRVMSHEVTNTVTASNSLLESSLAYASELAPASRADLEAALRVAIDRTRQLNEFMRRFADVFRLSPPVLEPVDPARLLEPIVRLLSAQAGLPHVRWEWAVAGDVGLVHVDRPQFEQACLNIVKNAMEAAGSGGLVRIDVRREATDVRLTVEDSGPEIGAEVRAHLFTPFFSTKPQGQGIGLTLVQEILGAHRFEYELVRDQGGPTRFVIRMPAG